MMRLVEQLRAWRADHDVGDPAELVVASLAVEQIIREVGVGGSEDMRVIELEVFEILKELDEWASFSERETMRTTDTQEQGEYHGVVQRVTGTRWAPDTLEEPWKCCKCGEVIIGAVNRNRETVYVIGDDEHLGQGVKFAWGQYCDSARHGAMPV